MQKQAAGPGAYSPEDRRRFNSSDICNLVARNKNVSESFLIMSLFFCRQNPRLDSGTCTFTRVGRSELSRLGSSIHACLILYYVQYIVIHCSPVAPCSAQNAPRSLYPSRDKRFDVTDL